MSVATDPRPTREQTIIRALPAVIEMRAEEGEDTRPLLVGHFSRFNEWTEINSFFEGRFLERIAPGAFRKTFRERKDELRVLFQHGRDPSVGDKPIAEIETLREDEEGAYHESRLLDGIPELIVSGLRAGLYGQSFRMEVLREEVHDEPGVSDHNPAGIPERTIKEIRLHEFGPVTFPAYKNTTPAVRSLTDEFVFDTLARDPERAREMLHEVREAGLSVIHGTMKGHAPSERDDAAQVGTSSKQERRDPPGRFGLSTTPARPSWAL